jgi:hypothetical protein
VGLVTSLPRSDALRVDRREVETANTKNGRHARLATVTEKTTMNHQTDAQRQMIAQFKAESCLDRKVPLGIPFAARPEFGPVVPAYYQNKHRTDGPGQFYGLHIVGTMQRIHTN